MDLTEFAAGAAVIIGIVNGVRLALEQDKRGFFLFAVACVSGLGLGFLGWYGLTPQIGLAIAVGSSGVYKTAQLIGGRS